MKTSMSNLQLLDIIATPENLWAAFRECSRGKRSKLGYQRALFGAGEKLIDIRYRLLSGTYKWQGYREFMVKHIRYMDDIVILAQHKHEALDCAHAVVKFAAAKLALNIPFTKFVPLASAPVPFLGYLLNHDGYSILARNRRRFCKHLRRLQSRGHRPSRIAQAVLAHSAWTAIPEKAKNAYG